MRKKWHQEKDKSYEYNDYAYKIYLPKGILRFPDGQKIELYSIGVIADVISRNWREIRDWEFRGLIPLSPFCDKFGRRLYTKDMIRTIVRCAEEYKIPEKRGRCHIPFEKRAFFINLAVRLEKLYSFYKARLEIKIPKEYEVKNQRYIREYVLNSPAYKEFLLEKERKKNEAQKNRKIAAKKRFWNRWRNDPKFRESVNGYFIRREKYFERIGKPEIAEKIRKGRQKYYNENGECIIPCEN